MIHVIGKKIEVIPTRPDFEIWKLNNGSYLCLMDGDTIIRDWEMAHVHGYEAPPTAFDSLKRARERFGDLALMVAQGNKDAKAEAHLREWARKLGLSALEN